MKKLLISLIIYIVIVATLVVTVNLVFVRMDRSDGDHTDKFKAVPEHIEVCNLGSSHGLYGIDYSSVEDKTCFNFALSSQSLSYDLRILGNYIERIEEGGTVYIVVSYFSIYGIEETEEEDFATKNRRYYKFLPRKRIKNYNVFDEIIAAFPSLFSGSEIFNVLLGKRTTPDEQFRFRNAENIDIKQSAYDAYLRHVYTNKLAGSEMMNVNDTEISSLYGIIELCRANSLNPILVTTPFTRAYLDAISENDALFYDDFYGRINIVVEETAVPYYDYSHDERFIDKYYLFMDSDHLNMEGSAMFTKVLLEETLGRE